MAIDLTKLEKKFIDLFANVTKEEFEQWLLTKTKPMAQQTIEVKINYNELMPTEERYVATINNENYKIVVSADSIANCFKELSKSIFVADSYQKPN